MNRGQGTRLEGRCPLGSSRLDPLGVLLTNGFWGDWNAFSTNNVCREYANLIPVDAIWVPKVAPCCISSTRPLCVRSPVRRAVRQPLQQPLLLAVQSAPLRLSSSVPPPCHLHERRT